MTTPRTPRSTLGPRFFRAVLVPGLLALVACSGPQAPDVPPEQVLASAKHTLDETSGVHIVLETKALPSGVNGILRAEGVGTHAPAFDGTIKVMAGGLAIDVPVVSVGDVVHAKLPFTTKYAVIEPEDYGAPDPADLMATDGGLSSLLTAAEDVRAGEQQRDGDTVLDTYTGTLPGTAVAAIIPGAAAGGDFDATFTITADQVLNEAVLTGPFYPGADDVTYTVAFDQYDTSKEITAP